MITLFGIFLDEFRGKVVWSSTEASLVIWVFRDEGRVPEVNEPHLPIVFDDDILELQIFVNHALSVHESDAFDDIVHNFSFDRVLKINQSFPW